jgi:molybdopterin synthase catalytic subunit
VTTHAHDTTRIHPPRRRVVLTEISDRPLDATAHERAVTDPRAGGLVTFRGAVRDHDGGRAVIGIEYQAHPTAASVLADAEAVAVTHRIGELGIGDDAIVVAVSAAHRHEAFAACALIVDEVKHRLPVWKRQRFADGTDEWVHCP